MNNQKEPIKMKLSSSVIITIIIMTLSFIIIFFLTESLEKEKEMKESNKYNQTETSTIDSKNSLNETKETKKNSEEEDNKLENDKPKTNEKEKKISGIKMIQFNEVFYNVVDIALESRECEKVKNFKDFEYDLDSDGKKDKVTIVHKTKKGYDGRFGDIDEDIYEFKLNDKTFHTEEDPHFTTMYIADLNKNDKSIEIVIFDDGPSDDPNCTIYSKKDSKMIKLENLGWDLYTNQKGKLVCSEIHRAETNPKVFPNYFMLENNKIKKYDLDLSNVKNEVFTAEDVWFTEDLKNIEKYWNLISDDIENEDNYEKTFNEAGIYKLTEKDKFNVIKYVDGIDIQIKLKDGRKGYILGNHFSD